MKTFRQYLKESKEIIKEDWNDKTLFDDCRRFLHDMATWELDKKNQTKRWNMVLGEFDIELSQQFIFEPLKPLNDEFEKIKEDIRKSYNSFNDKIFKECTNLLKRIDKEYKNSKEKEILEELRKQIISVQKNIK